MEAVHDLIPLAQVCAQFIDLLLKSADLAVAVLDVLPRRVVDLFCVSHGQGSEGEGVRFFFLRRVGPPR